MDDFSDTAASKTLPVSLAAAEETKKGQKRPWLKVWETLPAQLLNAYGQSKWPRMSDESVWDHMIIPLKSGAMYGTELASSDVERRGVGLNRWMYALLEFCKYQKQDMTMKQNKYMLQDKIYIELYDEIDNLQPLLEYCLAPKKNQVKKGSSSLRSGQTEVSQSVSLKDPKELTSKTKELYDWLQKSQSRIRGLATFQCAGGVSHCAAVYNKSALCFAKYGNKEHPGNETKVSLIEFQAAVAKRHELSDAGINEGDENTKDFA